MRSVAEYLARAAAFDELARSTSEPSLQKRYADIAECYRLLAEERRRLITEGTIESETGEALILPPWAQAHRLALGLIPRLDGGVVGF